MPILRVRNVPLVLSVIAAIIEFVPTPILATKLYAPPHRPKLVPRPCILEKLNEGLHRRLTLISAPAGFGKTTLASEWISGCMRPSAWLSLDEGDSDFARFLMYFIAALRTIKADIGTRILAVLQSPLQTPTESVLTSLLNEIDAMPDDFILVLDDYHAIDAKPVDDALAFMLEHLPPRMHLVITTREDPDLPLAKWRTRGQLTELRAADLRFSASEASIFFNRTMGLDLSEDDIAALENRTEGWIAGLQMAALSMQGRKDSAGFIQAFSGSHRFVLDYLLEEVLQRQSELVHDFLLQTAILDGLCGPLCDEVTGRKDGGEMLEALERGNLFVVPLDDKRRWYRYHQLFADVLKSRLMEAQRDTVSLLHRRASGWYEKNGLPSEAIAHALAAEDFERAAGLIELAWPAMEGSPQASMWLGWVKALSDELVRERPVLSVWHAYAFLACADLEAAESRLKDAEGWLANPSAKMVVTDEREFRSLPGTIAVARAYIAQAVGDLSGTVTYTRRALELLPEEDHFRREQATGLLGLSCWASGDLETAGRIFTDYTKKFRSARNIPDAIGTAFVLVDIRLAQGQLREAAGTLEQTLQFVVDQGGPVPPDAAELYRGLSELHRERGDLESALRYSTRSKELGGQGELLVLQHRLYVAEAHMRRIQGDLDGALDLLFEAERVYIRTPLPVIRPIPAMKARIWVAQGKLAEALAWAREESLSVDDELNYLHEYGHLTLARILMARRAGDPDDSIRQAMGLLERLLKAAEPSGRKGSVIEILVLQALAQRAEGDIPLALATLESALILAEPEGYVRIFVDEGPAMAELLTKMNTSKKSGTPGMVAYIHKLLAAFGKQTPAAAVAPLSQGLLDPLSKRELEVLGLIGQGLSNQEIGDRLFLALDTVKSHNRKIFEKLDVKRRTEALARARGLGLL
ncbi:MAG TPA: helix-turn-helix transcriptional regulator [Treponema sp.]|nr:helix-turn-helix transcriptional regulator [Treponema sp.]